MSRSIGDHIVRSIGVICDPDVEVYQLTQKHCVLVMGSDGLFDYLDNDQIADLVWENRNKPAEDVAKKLVKLSVDKWKEKDSVIDDCTCIVVYLSYRS